MEESSDDWILLTSSSSAIAMEIAKGRLESEGILAVIHNKQDSNYGFGSVELHVRRSDFLRAKNLIDL
ncbi:MAG: DUF2007 domain-containing protein [Flavobacteriales bacterium]|nr:DUF2007 domain-containing protein [Flavobacteriales bacterium]